MSQKILIKMLKKVFKLEHKLYCFTQCRVEFPLHRCYYRRAEKVYTDYLEKKKYAGQKES